MRLTAAGNLGIGTSTFNSTNPEKLVVDAGNTSSVNAIVGKGNINNYLQLNIQNSNAGTNASSDVVATADNGNETSNYVDMGINSSANTSGTMGSANDSYLYNIGQNFLMGTGTPAKSLIFMTGGTSQSSNERMRVDGSGNVGIGNTGPSYKLDVNGPIRTGNGSSTTGSVVFSNSTNGNAVTLNSGITSASYSLTLPTAQGGASTVLSNNGTGTLSWNTIAAASGSWSILGNAGTIPGTNFLGTTDNQSLVFKANNQLSGKIDLVSNNTLFGYQAGLGNTSGISNTYLGYQSGYPNTSGQGNTSVGGISMVTNTSGSGNAALGYAALKFNTTGGNNTSIGNSSGITNTTGTNNTFIGNGADATAGGLSYATAIGFNAKAASSNSLILGGTGVAGVNVGIGTNTFNGTYPEKLVVDAGTTTSVNAIVGKGSINNYLQLNIQNSNAGTNASSDVVATADNGNETVNYIDMGINSSVNTSAVMGNADDAYLYTTGNNFLIGTGTTAKALVFMTGGTSQSSNERMRIDGSGNVGIGVTNPSYKLQVSSGSNPLQLSGLQTGANTDSVLTVSNGVVRRLNASALISSSSNAWGLTGNASTNPSSNFIGTTDAQPILIKENSTQVARFDANSIAIGNGATTSNSTQSYSLGSTATVGFNKTAAMAFGNNSAINADSSFALGTAAVVNGSNSFAIGNGASSNNTNSFAIGKNAVTAYSITDAVAIGTNATANSSNSIAIGSNTTSASKTVTNAVSAIALGNAALSNSTNAIAIGTGATTGYNLTNPVSIGAGSLVNGNNGVAVGNGSSISFISNATVVGALASASSTANNSTAIGYNTDITKSDEVILGDMTNSALSVGIGSESFSSTNREKLLVDAGTTTSVNSIVGKGSIDSYLQLNIQNNSSGTSASSDVVATANNGNETSNYVDMGINGGSYSGGVMGAANDGYLYTMGNNFLLGTGNASKSLVFMTGGTSQSTNERMRIDGNGNVGIGTNNPGNRLEVNSGTGGVSGLRLKQLPAGAVLFMSSTADVTQNNSNLYFDGTNYRLSVAGGTSPASTLQVGGSIASAIVTKTANYTAGVSDHTILCNNVSGAITITLPAAAGCTGRMYVNKKISGAGNNVTIQGNFGVETIDGVTTKTLTNQYDALMIQSDGTAWYVLSKN
jgi:hypothetical protein